MFMKNEKNKIMEIIKKKKTETCCPQFQEEKWYGKTFNRENKYFIKTSILTMFHIPFHKILKNRKRH